MLVVSEQDEDGMGNQYGWNGVCRDWGWIRLFVGAHLAIATEMVLARWVGLGAKRETTLLTDAVDRTKREHKPSHSPKPIQTNRNLPLEAKQAAAQPSARLTNEDESWTWCADDGLLTGKSAAAGVRGVG